MITFSSHTQHMWTACTRDKHEENPAILLQLSRFLEEKKSELGLEKAIITTPDNKGNSWLFLEIPENLVASTLNKLKTTGKNLFFEMGEEDVAGRLSLPVKRDSGYQSQLGREYIVNTII